MATAQSRKIVKKASLNYRARFPRLKYNFVRSDVGNLAMKLAVALHLPPEKDQAVKGVVESVSASNRDPHLLFNQVGQKAGLIPANIVSSAFISLWLAGNTGEVKRISDFIRANVEATKLRGLKDPGLAALRFRLDCRIV
jgi:hypothetical protein